VPRQRIARLPVLDAPVRRVEGLSSRRASVLKARLVAVSLVLVSLALITVYFRESSGGALHSAQRVGLSVLMPFEVAGERVARPFRDAWGYTSDLFHAKSENERLRDQLEAIRQRVVQQQTSAQENKRLRRIVNYISGPKFPDDYRGVVTRVVARPASAYSQVVLVAAGSGDGVKVNDPAVTEDGLVGLVTDVTSNASEVTLLTDQTSAVSALVLETGAAGVVRHGPSDGSALVLDRVGKDELVNEGDLVITAGWRTGKLESLYPRGVAIGVVKSVGQQDVDLYKRVQLEPLVDFDSLAEVVILVQRPQAKAKKK
jgi:rod shape-determining protein MreC